MYHYILTDKKKSTGRSKYRDKIYWLFSPARGLIFGLPPPFFFSLLLGKYKAQFFGPLHFLLGRGRALPNLFPQLFLWDQWGSIFVLPGSFFWFPSFSILLSFFFLFIRCFFCFFFFCSFFFLLLFFAFF